MELAEVLDELDELEDNVAEDNLVRYISRAMRSWPVSTSEGMRANQTGQFL